jgi:hypothetical protein
MPEALEGQPTPHPCRVYRPAPPHRGLPCTSRPCRGAYAHGVSPSCGLHRTCGGADVRSVPKASRVTNTLGPRRLRRTQVGPITSSARSPLALPRTCGGTLASGTSPPLAYHFIRRAHVTALASSACSPHTLHMKPGAQAGPLRPRHPETLPMCTPTRALPPARRPETHCMPGPLWVPLPGLRMVTLRMDPTPTWAPTLGFRPETLGMWVPKVPSQQALQPLMRGSSLRWAVPQGLRRPTLRRPSVESHGMTSAVRPGT